MIRHQLARILTAIADRLEPVKPPVQIQYVYVYSTPPVMPAPTYPTPYWQGPWTSKPSPNICTSLKVDGREIASAVHRSAGGGAGTPVR